MLPRIAFPFLISLGDAGPITSDLELKVDCSKYNEHKELIRGPRPDYPDDYDQYGADSPPELNEDQKKICEDEWNLEQYREWVNTNANRIQVKEEDCRNVKKVTDRGPRPDFTEFEEPSVESQELQATDLNEHLVEIYCEEFQDILLLSNSTFTTEYSTETVLDTTISTSTLESTSTATTTTTTTTTETVAENLFDSIIYQSESQSLSNDEICEYNNKACCPLFVQSNNPIWSRYGSWENIFDSETVISLEDSRLKKMCHKENFSPCCVTPQLCQLQSQYGAQESLPHCDEDFGTVPSKFGAGEDFENPAGGSEESSEDSSEEDSSSEGSEDYEGLQNREGVPEATAAPIIEDPRSEDEINATKEGAFYGIVVIICLLALIVLLIIGTFIGKKCSPGTGGYTEGNSLIAGNVEDQEIEDQEEVQQQQQVQN